METLNKTDGIKKHGIKNRKNEYQLEFKKHWDKKM